MRAGYLFNSTIAGIDEADALLIIGSNPRIEAAVLNARIRRNWLATRMPVGIVGPEMDLTYDAEQLGDDAATLAAILDGKSKFAAKLKRAGRIVSYAMFHGTWHLLSCAAMSQSIFYV